MTFNVPLTVIMTVVTPDVVDVEVENCPVMTKPVPPMPSERVPLAMTDAEWAAIVIGLPSVSFKGIPLMLLTAVPVELIASSALTASEMPLP